MGRVVEYSSRTSRNIRTLRVRAHPTVLKAGPRVSFSPEECRDSAVFLIVDDGFSAARSQKFKWVSFLFRPFAWRRRVSDVPSFLVCIPFLGILYGSVALFKAFLSMLEALCSGEFFEQLGRACRERNGRLSRRI